MKNDASNALSYPQKRTACRVRSYERLKFGNSIMVGSDQVRVTEEVLKAIRLRAVIRDAFYGAKFLDLSQGSHCHRRGRRSHRIPLSRSQEPSGSSFGRLSGAMGSPTAVYFVPSRRRNELADVLALLRQFSSTVDRDNIRSDKLRKLQQHRPQQLRRPRPLHGVPLHRGRRHRDRRHRGRRQRDQRQRLFGMRRRQLKWSQCTRCQR